MVGTRSLSGLDAYPDVYTVTTVSAEHSQLQSPDYSAFVIPGLKDGAPITNAENGEREYWGHLGDPVYTRNRMFLQHLGLFDKSIEDYWWNRLDFNTPTLDWSARAYALMGYRLLLGQELTFETAFLGANSEFTDPNGHTTADGLRDYLEACGLSVKEIYPGQQSIPENVVMLNMTAMGAGRGLDIGLIRLVDGIILKSRPGKHAASMPLEQWIQRSNGANVLLLAESVVSEPAFGIGHVGTGSWKFAAAVVGVIGMMSGLIMIVRRYRLGSRRQGGTT